MVRPRFDATSTAMPRRTVFVLVLSAFLVGLFAGHPLVRYISPRRLSYYIPDSGRRM
jgi:hypothetical protein